MSSSKKELVPFCSFLIVIFHRYKTDWKNSEKLKLLLLRVWTAPVKNSEVVIKLKQTKIALIVGLQQDNKWLVCTECQASLIFRKLCDFERS